MPTHTIFLSDSDGESEELPRGVRRATTFSRLQNGEVFKRETVRICSFGAPSEKPNPREMKEPPGEPQLQKRNPPAKEPPHRPSPERAEEQQPPTPLTTEQRRRIAANRARAIIKQAKGHLYRGPGHASHGQKASHQPTPRLTTQQRERIAANRARAFRLRDALLHTGDGGRDSALQVKNPYKQRPVRAKEPPGSPNKLILPGLGWHTKKRAPFVQEDDRKPPAKPSHPGPRNGHQQRRDEGSPSVGKSSPVSVVSVGASSVCGATKPANHEAVPCDPYDSSTSLWRGALVGPSRPGMPHEVPWHPLYGNVTDDMISQVPVTFDTVVRSMPGCPHQEAIEKLEHEIDRPRAQDATRPERVGETRCRARMAGVHGRSGQACPFRRGAAQILTEPNEEGPGRRAAHGGPNGDRKSRVPIVERGAG